MFTCHIVNNTRIKNYISRNSKLSSFVFNAQNEKQIKMKMLLTFWLGHVVQFGSCESHLEIWTKVAQIRFILIMPVM